VTLQSNGFYGNSTDSPPPNWREPSITEVRDVQFSNLRPSAVLGSSYLLPLK